MTKLETGNPKQARNPNVEMERMSHTSILDSGFGLQTSDFSTGGAA